MRKGILHPVILLGTAPLLTCIPAAADGHDSLNDHWSIVGDFVYMRRTEIHNHSLVEDANKFQCPGACPNFTVINNKKLVQDFEFEPGYRVGMTYMPSERNSFEMNFLYLQPWHGEKERHGDASLSFPFSHTYSNDFTDASEAHAWYESHFWDLEFNFWRNFNPRRVDPFCISGIVGMRYFHWDEQFKLSMINPPDKSDYNIHTQNRMFGLQVGFDFQMNLVRWMNWDFSAKAGSFANHTEQKQFLGDFDDTVTLRHSERQKRELGFYADVAAQVGFQCFEHWNLHVGYQVMFFTGLSLAPEQISKRTTKNAGKKDHTHGNAILDGVYVGLLWSF